MKKAYLFSQICLLILVVSLTVSCNSQNKTNSQKKEETNSSKQLPKSKNSQIGEYITEIFEDSNGNLWFGTIANGVAKYNGKSLKYFTTRDGLPSNRIVSVIEDKIGDLWFGTGLGLSQYDGKTFTNFTTENGICDNRISNLLIDSRGDFWIGTWNGVCKFDGNKFINFKIPIPTIKTQLNEDTKKRITEIMEDSKGNIWIGRDGYGATRYDGKSFAHFVIEDGLYSNNVQEITEDKNGNIWFGSRVSEKDNPDQNNRFGKGGVTKYDGETFIHYPKVKGLNKNDVYEIYNDNSDNLWIGTLSNGVYKYDGENFENYNVPKSIMNILEDRKGTLWLGCAGGLFRLNSDGIINVTTNGPWK